MAARVPSLSMTMSRVEIKCTNRVGEISHAGALISCHGNIVFASVPQRHSDETRNKPAGTGRIANYSTNRITWPLLSQPASSSSLVAYSWLVNYYCRPNN